MARNVRAPVFRPPWLPSRAEQLAAFRIEWARWQPRPDATARGYNPGVGEAARRRLKEEPARVAVVTRATYISRASPEQAHLQPQLTRLLIGAFSRQGLPLPRAA
jgi:hypothetical protein